MKFGDIDPKDTIQAAAIRSMANGLFTDFCLDPIHNTEQAESWLIEKLEEGAKELNVDLSVNLESLGQFTVAFILDVGVLELSFNLSENTTK